MAGEERIELSITVLETAVIPFNYSPSENSKEYDIEKMDECQIKKIYRKRIILFLYAYFWYSFAMRETRPMSAFPA